MKLEDVNITDDILKAGPQDEEGSGFDYDDSGYDYSDEDE